MNPIDKEAANDAAKEAVAAYAALTSIESESTSDKSTKSNKGSNKTPTESDEHFGIMAAKPKSRKHINRRKRETRKKIKEGGGGGRQNGDYPGSDDDDTPAKKSKPKDENWDDDGGGYSESESEESKKAWKEQLRAEVLKYRGNNRENIKATTEKISKAIHIINAVNPIMVKEMMMMFDHKKWYDADEHERKADKAANELVNKVVTFRSLQETDPYWKERVDKWFEKIAKGEKSIITDDYEGWQEWEMWNIDKVMNKVTVDAYNAAAISLFGRLEIEWSKRDRKYFFNYDDKFNDPSKPRPPEFVWIYKNIEEYPKHWLSNFKQLRKEWRDQPENPEFGKALRALPRWFPPPPPSLWEQWEQLFIKSSDTPPPSLF